MPLTGSQLVVNIYDEAHALLQVKAKRAAERKAEMLAHKKNIRTGKVSKKKKAAAAEEEKKAAALRKEGEQQSRAEDSRPQRAPMQPAAPKTADQLFEEKLKAFMSESDSKISSCRQYSDHRTKNRRR